MIVHGTICPMFGFNSCGICHSASPWSWEAYRYPYCMILSKCSNQKFVLNHYIIRYQMNGLESFLFWASLCSITSLLLTSVTCHYLAILTVVTDVNVVGIFNCWYPRLYRSRSLYADWLHTDLWLVVIRSHYVWNAYWWVKPS